MTNWIILTVLYAIINGVFQCAKKKSIEKNSIFEVLAVFSLLAFLIAALMTKESIVIGIKPLIIILFKSFIIVIAWLLALKALETTSISVYGLVNLSRIVFSVVLSIILLGEKLTILTLLGLVIIIFGLALVNKFANNNEEKEANFKSILMLLASCLLNAFSAIIDKYITKDITGTQLQFWFLLFLTIIYWIILLIKQKRLNFKAMNKNYWIVIAAVCLAVEDKFLFIANEIETSKVSIMTGIKQLSTIEIIILGKILFKEKNTLKKLACSMLIIFGIILTLI